MCDENKSKVDKPLVIRRLANGYLVMQYDNDMQFSSRERLERELFFVFETYEALEAHLSNAFTHPEK